MVDEPNDLKIFHLNLPATPEDIARLEIGAVVYLGGREAEGHGDE